MYSSSMKSVTAWEAIRSMREAVSLIPYGNLNAYNIILQYADGVPYATYEGDNNVLL